MAIVCVWIPAFRLAVARMTQSTIDLAAPLILADRIERGRVVDCTLSAAELGVRAGMTLVQAQAVATEARTAFDDPAADARVWSQVLDAFDTASPIVEDDGLGRAYLDMHGIGGPLRQAQDRLSTSSGQVRGWIAAVRDALAGLHDEHGAAMALPARIGVGPNRFVARAATRRAKIAVCDARDDPAAFVAPLPLDLLNIDERVRARLGLLGVTTLGELAALPHGPFVRRFGSEAAVWHARARGVDDEPLRPRPRELRVDRTLYGEGEASSEEQVLFALRTLAGWVVDDLSAAGKRAGRLVLTLDCEDGETRELTVRVAQPTAVASTLFELLRARLEGVTLGAAVVGLRLAAEELAGGGVALSLFSASDPDPDAIGVVLARLDAAFGTGKALRAHVLDGPRIERRFRFAPFTLERIVTGTAPSTVPPLPATATLQLRLIPARPVDVRVIDGAPRFVGSPPQQALEVAGPWRVEESWWAPVTGEGTPLARDEYDVGLEDGSLLRIARERDTWTVRGIYD